MAFGFGGNRQALPQSQAAQGSPAPGGNTYNFGDNVDVEFGKHIFKISEYKKIFRELFAGWREMDTVEEVEMFGRRKTKQTTEIVVDYNSRTCNEAGADYLHNAIMPLIGAASTSAKLPERIIRNNWRARVWTCRAVMLSQYHFPKLRCMEGTDYADGVIGCEFVTENSAVMREHFRTFGHSKYTKTINAYGLDVDRWPEAAVTLLNMSTITYGGLDGFKTKQITEHYVSTNQSIANPYQMQPQQGGGFVNWLTGRSVQQR